MQLTRKPDTWDPFNILSELQTDLDRSFNRQDNGERSFQPLIDVREEGDQYVLHADLPGVKKEDIHVSVEGSQLILKGERKAQMENKEKGYHYFERQYGSFVRHLEFPVDIDAGKIKASFKEGVLEVSIPKAETVKPKQIKVD